MGMRMSQVNPMRGVRTLLICLALPVAGEVAEVDDYGFVSTHVIAIEAPPERVFTAPTREVGQWWDPAHSHFGDAGNLLLDTIYGLCEVSRSGDGLVRHMSVDLWRPGRALRLRGGLGPLQTLGVAGSMTFDCRKPPTPAPGCAEFAVVGSTCLRSTRRTPSCFARYTMRRCWWSTKPVPRRRILSTACAYPTTLTSTRCAARW